MADDLPMSSSGETVFPKNTLSRISFCIFVQIVENLIFSLLGKLLYLFFFFLNVFFLFGYILTLFCFRFTVTLFLVYNFFIFFWLFLPKVFFFPIKYSCCCFSWYCWCLCLTFLMYFFNSVFSFTTESQLFLAPWSIFLCQTTICLLFWLLFCILPNFF